MSFLFFLKVLSCIFWCYDSEEFFGNDMHNHIYHTKYERPDASSYMMFCHSRCISCDNVCMNTHTCNVDCNSVGPFLPFSLDYEIWHSLYREEDHNDSTQRLPISQVMMWYSWIFIKWYCEKYYKNTVVHLYSKIYISKINVVQSMGYCDTPIQEYCVNFVEYTFFSFLYIGGI